MPKKEPTGYRILVGCDYNGQRHEPGETVTDIPADVVDAWLAEQVIEVA